MRTLSNESATDEIDDHIVLSPDHVQRVTQFRNEIRLCKTDLEKYELCVRVRDDLLCEHTGVQLLAAACEHVMFTQCAGYKDWKESRDKRPAVPIGPNEADVAEWNRFLGVAKDGIEIKSKCLSALKTVAHYWGQDIVQHYQWAYRGRKYCDKLCAAAREVHDWKKAVTGLNLSMLERSQQGMSLKRRSLRASLNPIEQGDLDHLRKHPPEDGLAIDLPDGFGFDKFGLMVHEEFAAVLPEPYRNGTADSPTLPEADNADTTVPSRPNGAAISDPEEPTDPPVLPEANNADRDGLVAEVINNLLTAAADIAIHDSHNQPNPDSENTVATVTETAVPRSHDSTTSEKSIGMTLRARTKMSYEEPAGGGGTSKPRQPRLLSVDAPKIPLRCCPAEVPSTLLSALNNPFMFGAEAAEQFSPFLTQLCRSHLQLFAARTSAIASQKAISIGNQDTTSVGSLSMSTNRPARRRTASLPDIIQQMPKRPRLDGSPSFPYMHTIRSGITRDRPMHNRMADDAYRRRALAELQEKPGQAMPPRDSHGEGTNILIHKLLEQAQQPNTDNNRGIVEALFCTGDEAARLVESELPCDTPIITDGQQQFRWSKGDRPIVQLFRRMGGLDKSVSVQVPSRSSTSRSFEVRKLSEVRKRFLDQKNTSDPWNILDLQSPLPQSILPNFLTGENCQLLLQVRNTVLMEESAERVVASTQQWNEWKNVLEWVLLSEGGHNTAPHMDSHGFATWITAQEGLIGFGWMACPTEEERGAWMADPHRYTGGKWRYIVLKPGQSVFFLPGTIHFVFRVRDCQTLALGGHILQWSGIKGWMQVVLAQIRNPAITNEDMKRSAPNLVHAVAKLVAAKVKEGGVEELGSEVAVREFFESVKVRLSQSSETRKC
ncbi:ATP synthase subunit alpha [Madurella mycetomatis]|uniref:ATP synthase subunit alpha n=1 Tax=Madurella mycetomatis TaxID=100816 RepID=A0A175WC97_9PEZI|nr:ATP synthase subunit alpha [Madurella mycetomatis]